MKILKQSSSYLTKLPEHEIEGKLLITQKDSRVIFTIYKRFYDNKSMHYSVYSFN